MKTSINIAGVLPGFLNITKSHRYNLNLISSWVTETRNKQCSHFLNTVLISIFLLLGCFVSASISAGDVPLSAPQSMTASVQTINSEIAFFDFTTGNLHLPSVYVQGLGVFEANLHWLMEETESIQFILHDAKLISSAITSPVVAGFIVNDGFLYIPNILVSNDNNGILYIPNVLVSNNNGKTAYVVDMQLIENSNPLQFFVTYFNEIEEIVDINEFWVCFSRSNTTIWAEISNDRCNSSSVITVFGRDYSNAHDKQGLHSCLSAFLPATIAPNRNALTEIVDRVSACEEQYD